MDKKKEKSQNSSKHKDDRVKLMKIDLTSSVDFELQTSNQTALFTAEELSKIAAIKADNPDAKKIVIYAIPKNQIVPFNKVIRVQKNYYYLIGNEILVMNQETINSDFWTNAHKDVKKYAKFVNEPMHINYKEDLGKNFNLYRPISHKPVQGNWDTIKKMLEHIFKGIHYKMILTYLHVMYKKPKQQLPFIGLVSKGKNTGKTTFLEFIKDVFEENAKVIDPQDLVANFNESYINKIAILIDEKIEGKNRQKELQNLKKLITGGTQTRKAKFQADVDIVFYGKIFMASNDEISMLALEEENARFWILDVPELKEEDFNFKEKVKNEIPAFLYYLAYDFNPLEKKSRLWLNIDDIQTERAKAIIRDSRPDLTKEIIEILTDYFVENEDKNEIKFTANQFRDAFGKPNWSVNYVVKTLKDSFGKESTIIRSSNPFYFKTNKNIREDENWVKQRRYYTFTKEEVDKLNPNSNFKCTVDNLDDIENNEAPF